MCGIFGFVQLEQQNDALTKSLLRKLALLSEARGKDASGLIGVSPSNIRILKRSMRIKNLLATPEFEQLFSVTQTEIAHNAPAIFLGHTRMVTNGASNLHENNQPCIGQHFVCLHNGIIVNEQSLRQEENLTQDEDVVDTQVLIELMERYYEEHKMCSLSMQKTFNKIKGANSIAFICSDLNNIYLTSANGSLFVATSNNLMIFASEKYIVEQVIKAHKKNLNYADFHITQVLPNHACCVAFSKNHLGIKHLEAQNLSSVQDNKAQCTRSISDFPKAPISPDASTRYTGSYTALEKLCDFDTSPINAMRRCTKCLLPESFPYIKFDHEGVCNFCHSYVPWEAAGKDALENLLQPVRSKSNAVDCLLPVSGGRDSSYLLHYLCKEAQMKPIAYTYDWGMVTDLARRNISRMCGELGIEHILISANIRQKRANIRKNVQAWLKKPHLGTVTLFMAGDKPYFYYAYMLRRQMNIKYTLLGANKLERTDFKVGFCNIENNTDKSRFYSLNIMNKARLLAFFGMQFINNPSYLNSSLLDTALGFASYYILPCDYINMYDYISWDEQTINNTLLNTYDWETATDTKSTWRIGDGTASFYNYIYYKMAGFSENDTFRSNQIRQGMISREQALELTLHDNIPRVESIKWYCDTIGIDAYKAIESINMASTLYKK